jgi:hypothetical protein
MLAGEGKKKETSSSYGRTGKRKITCPFIAVKPSDLKRQASPIFCSSYKLLVRRIYKIKKRRPNELERKRLQHKRREDRVKRVRRQNKRLLNLFFE